MMHWETHRASALSTLLLILSSLATAQATSSVEIRDAWIRWLPGNLPAGGYLTVVNNGDSAVKLLTASSADYAEVSIHQSTVQGGVNAMTPVESITVAAHSRLVFADHGYHLMLMQPKKALLPGSHVVISLQLASGASLATQFEVRAPDAR